jgi:teichuronic acid biosynthesis glycosyltransferase TuaC
MLKIRAIFRSPTPPFEAGPSEQETQQHESSPLQVLVLSHMFPDPLEPYTGIFVLEQIRALRNLGVKIIVIAPKPWVPPLFGFLPRFQRHRVIPPRASVCEFKVEYPRVPQFPGGRFFCLYGLFFYLRCLGIVRKLAKQSKIDLIHAHAIMPDGFAAALLGRTLNIPVVCTIHGSDINDYPWQNRITFSATKWASRAVDGLVAVSHDLRDKVFSLIGARQLAVVHNGSDPEIFKPLPSKQARIQLGLPLNKKIVLFVGNLLPVKGIEFLLEAVSKLQRSDILLCLVGDGILKSSLLSLADRLGIAHVCKLIGARPYQEIPFWLCAADCLVLSSLSEGLGSVLTEAMLCRVPVIATAVGGIPDIVRHGYTGTLVPPKDPSALAKALDTLFDGDVRFSVMVDQAEIRAKAELTCESGARKILCVYRDQISSWSRRRMRTDCRAKAVGSVTR